MLSIKLSENNGKAPEAVPYMPAGANEICCTVNGRAGKRTVMVDRDACERLNADLQEHLSASKAGEKARPVLLFDHKAGNAAAVPVGFEWDEQRGILLRVDWTQAGRAAVEGGNYGYISPAFRLEHGSDRILGLQDGVEVGSLVNDPAFQRNECIAAAHAEPEDVVVYAANPYGCNQYGHEWRAKHGETGNGGKQKKEDKKDHSFETALKNTVPRERDENGKLLTVDDLEPLEIVKLENEQRDKRAEYSENNRKLEILSKELREAEKTASASRSEKDKKLAEKARKNWSDAKKKQDELTQRLRVIHKIFNPEWELKASFQKETQDGIGVYLPPHGDIENVQRVGDNIEAANESGREQDTNNDMETVKKMLGLDADASPADVAAAIAALKKKSADGQKRIDEVEAECNEHKKALAEHKEKAADGFIDRLKKAGKVAHKDEETLKAARAMYIENPERTERIYAAMQPICPAMGEEVHAGRVPNEGSNYESTCLADYYDKMDF